MNPMPLRKHRASLEALYRRYNRRAYVTGDPLELLYRFDNAKDREVAGMVAALLAYGRASQIVRSAELVLGRMTDRPGKYLRNAKPAELDRKFADFVYRIWTGRELVALLRGMRGVIRSHGSLADCFAASVGDQEDLLCGLKAFVDEIAIKGGGRCGSLLPDPAKGSACKRLHLFLRWMVRKDRVDPGGWDSISAAKLIVPLDVHMHRIGVALGATARKSADLVAAREITSAFRRICPDDPVRYDFALTRLGIRGDQDVSGLFSGRDLRGRPDA